MAAVEDPIELRFTNYKFTLHHKNTLMFSVEDVSVGVRSCSVNSVLLSFDTLVQTLPSELRGIKKTFIRRRQRWI